MMREVGWQCEVVERWNPFARIRQDLFGCIDIVAARFEIAGIQATSESNHAARRKKVLANDKARCWCAAGGKLAICSWRKKGRFWVYRMEWLTTEDFDGKENAETVRDVQDGADIQGK